MSDQAQPHSLLAMLIAWARYHVALAMAAMKPRFSAGEIAAVAAGSGQPAGV